MKPDEGHGYFSKASGKAVFINEVFEIRSDEWWVSLTYSDSTVTRSYSLDQFRAKFQQVKS